MILRSDAVVVPLKCDARTRVSRNSRAEGVPEKDEAPNGLLFRAALQILNLFALVI